MGAILHRTTKLYKTSINTPDFSDPPWLINPDVNALVAAAVPTRYWKIVGSVVSEMSAPEKLVVDQAVQTLKVVSNRTPDFDGVPRAPANGLAKHILTITKLDLAGNPVASGSETV